MNNWLGSHASLFSGLGECLRRCWFHARGLEALEQDKEVKLIELEH